MKLQNHEVVLSACAGIACFPTDADDADALLRKADTALHQAKLAGPGTIQYFANEMNARVLETLVLQASLRTAYAREHNRICRGEPLDAPVPRPEPRRDGVAGADAAQGYLFSKPLAPEACEQFLSAASEREQRKA